MGRRQSSSLPPPMVFVTVTFVKGHDTSLPQRTNEITYALQLLSVVCFQVMHGGRSGHPDTRKPEPGWHLPLGLLPTPWSTVTQHHDRLQRHWGRDRVQSGSARYEVRFLAVLLEQHEARLAHLDRLHYYR